MARQTKSQKGTIERVMHEFKQGELEQKGGRKIKDRKQAVAVALSEAGASKNASPEENRKNRRRTEANEAAGKTGSRATARRGSAGTGRRKASGASRTKADTKQTGTKRAAGSRSKTAAQGKTGTRGTKAASQKSAARRAKPRQVAKAGGGKTGAHKTRADLYREATRRGIAGRSRMSKQELERALAR